MIRYRAGYKYQLAESVVLNVPELVGFPDYRMEAYAEFLRFDGVHGFLHFRRGYAWDGPSGPTFDTRTFMAASLAHDGGAQVSRNTEMGDESRARFVAANNEVLYRLCIENGMWKWRAKWVYRGVSLVSGYADPSHRKEIYTA